MKWKSRLTRTPVIARYDGPVMLLLDKWMEEHGVDKHPSELTDEQWKAFHSEMLERLKLLVD